MNTNNDSQLVSPILSSRVPANTLQLLNRLAVDELSTAGACIQAAQVAIEVSALQKALSLSIRAVELQPENKMLHTSLITAYMFAKDNQGAIEHCDKYIQHFGDEPIVQSLLGNAYSGLGQFELAESAFRQALALDSKLTMAITGLSRCRKFNPEDAKSTLQLFDFALQQHIQVEDRSSILFAMAKVYNDIEKYELAWEKAEEANNLTDLKQPFTQKQAFSGFVDQLVSHSQQNQALSESQATPILIVGMPRSGTTLVEQILGAHKGLYPGGETPSIEYAIKLGASGKNNLSKFEVSELNQCANYYANYFQELHKKPDASQSIINKLPINFLNVGIFKQIFPQGKVIHLKRDYRDILVSTHFEQIGGSINYSNRLDNVVFMYKECMRLMQAWRARYPDILEIDYENLVKDYDNQRVRLADFLDLNIKDFGDFTKTDNSVETLSVWQARQGIYLSSLARYKRYKALSNLPASIDEYKV